MILLVPKRALVSTLVLCTVRPLTAFSTAFGARRSVPSSTLAAIAGKADNGNVAVVDTTTTCFTSEPMKVYIEDTDAYGVVYNANYLKFYDRALQMASSGSDSTLVPDDFCMVAVGHQKFRSSPALGDDFVVQGELIGMDDAQRQVWDLSMTSVDGKALYHTAEQVVVTTPHTTQWLPDVPAFTPIDDSSLTMTGGSSTDSFAAYRDEFDPLFVSHLPLPSVLNHFERPRSNLLGGPQELRRAQQEDGIIFVVGGIQELCLLGRDGKQQDSLVGDTLTVTTFCQVRKGGMRTDLYQTIYTSDGERMAQGIVTLYALNQETRRPTSKLPQRILDRLQMKRDPGEE
eukprot:scaffold3586_cov164-Amphora_coffeaeformis.AAC.5